MAKEREKICCTDNSGLLLKDSTLLLQPHSLEKKEEKAKETRKLGLIMVEEKDLCAQAFVRQEFYKAYRGKQFTGPQA